jgi:myo-inositol catabolism protein IolH
LHEGNTVKLALDPYMFRTTALLELPGLVADRLPVHRAVAAGISRRFLRPRASRDVVTRFKRALDAAGVEIATTCRCTDGRPDEDERKPRCGTGSRPFS